MTTALKPLAFSALLSLGAALAHAVPPVVSDAALQSEAQAMLSQKIPNGSKDLVVQVNDGTATLAGWTKSPIQEARARVLVSQVPGISKAYRQVRTWSSTGVQ